MKPKISFSEEQKDWIKRPLLSNIEKILDYRGRTPKKLGLSWSDTGFLALSALNVKNGYIDFNADANYGDQELYDRWMGDNHLHKGQVVFTTEAPMGNVAQIPNDDLYILSQRTIAFEVKHDLIREDFLATLLRSPKIFNELTSLSSGGTAKGVSQKSLSNLKVCVPASLDEQSAIGSLFHTLDDLLASYKDNLANYQSLKASTLSKMFPKAGQTAPEIRLDRFEGEWEEKEFSKLVKRVTQSSDSDSLPKVEFEDIISGQGQLNKDISSKFDNRKGIHFKPGYTLYGKLRPYLNNWLLPKFEGVALGDFWVFHPNGNDSNFIYYLVQSNRYQKVANDTSGTKMPRSDWKSVSSTIFAIPQTIAEQQAIGAYFSNLDNLINSYQEKISQLETLKKKLLQDMFI